MSKNSKCHWIKLYVEMLDDPKVGLLPDAVKWRWTSIILLAGEMNEDGFLPDVNDMAWRLHTNVETLQGEMRMLAGRGLVELRLYDQDDERWFIPAFATRQAAASGTERARMSRQRAQQNNSRNEHATIVQRNVANSLHKQKQKQNTETEAEAEGEGNGAGAPAPPPAPSPTSSPSFRPIPENVRKAKARRGESELEAVPDTLPVLSALHELTGYWPGEANAGAIAAVVGENPDRSTLARAVELWRASGHKVTNWLGICDWYIELSRDPDWTPQARFKVRPNGSVAPGLSLSPAEQAAERYVKAKRAILGENQ